MNLFCESGDTDRAIAEQERALPIEALKSVLEHRTKQHGKTAELRRVLTLMKAQQIVKEAHEAA